MSVNIPTHYVKEFTTNVGHLLQRHGGKFRGTVKEDRHYGEDAVAIDQFGSVEAVEVTTRYEPMPRTDPALDRVWVSPKDYDIPAIMVDKFDELKIMTDPRGKYAESSAMGMRRRMDDIILEAFFGDVRTGQDGTTSVAFDTTNHKIAVDVGASGDTGINVDKIIEGKKLLRENNVDLDEERCYIGITPQQEANLLRQEQVISTDKSRNLGIRTNDDGEIMSILGCRVVCSNAVSENLTNASGNVRCPLYVPSGIHLGIWSEVKTFVTQRDDLRAMPWQIYSLMSMRATRTEPGRVIEIECVE